MAGPLTSNGSTVFSGLWAGGRGAFVAQGTFDGATVKLQWQIPEGTNSLWTDVGSDTTLTASGGGEFVLPAGVKLQTVVSSAGASTSVFYSCSTINHITQTP